jgi:hypothetical protein
MGMPVERMSKVDTAWLRMDTPENLMMIVGIWTLKPRITVAALRQRCIERLLPYRRFRQRVEEDVMGAQWVEDEDFDIEALMPDDSPTRLKGKPGGRSAWPGASRCRWTRSRPSARAGLLGQRRAAVLRGRRHRRYLRGQGDNPAGKEIRAMVPVNLRPLDKAWQLGNRFGLAPLVLPIGIDNPVERVYAVRRA